MRHSIGRAAGFVAILVGLGAWTAPTKGLPRAAAPAQTNISATQGAGLLNGVICAGCVAAAGFVIAGGPEAVATLLASGSASQLGVTCLIQCDAFIEDL